MNKNQAVRILDDWIHYAEANAKHSQTYREMESELREVRDFIDKKSADISQLRNPIVKTKKLEKD